MLSCERCRGTLQSHNNSEEGCKKLAKTEPKQIRLQFCQKEVKDETVPMADGRLFHARDAATGKARSPRVNRCADGTTIFMVIDERRWQRPSTSAVPTNALREITVITESSAIFFRASYVENSTNNSAGQLTQLLCMQLQLDVL